ncbi:MAG: hypothetical protein ACXWDM_11910 [Nocardioides sp.]
MTPEDPQKLEIDWLKTAGGAFAAVSSAFLLSTLGAAGTIIGAALGSVIVTVGGALYSQGLARSHQRLAQVQAVAMRKVGVAQAEVRRAARNHGDGKAVDAKLTQAEERLDDVKDDLGSMADEPPGPGWQERLVVLPWKRILLIAAGLFVAAVLAITVFELVAGQSVSSITGGTDGDGGTTISRIGGGSDRDPVEEDDKVPPDDQTSPSDAPSSEPSDQPTPTSVPTDEPTPAPESPTPTVTPTTPTTPTTSDTVLPTDSATPSPTG